MKKICMLSAFCCISLIAFTQNDTVWINADLVHARIYHGYGAELEHRSTPALKKGMQTVIIDGIALQPDPASIQLNCGEEVAILSWQHRMYYKPASPVPVLKQPDSITLLQKEINVTDSEISIQDDMNRRVSMLIENNFTTPDKKNITSEEIIKLTEYYTRKISEGRRLIFNLHLKKNNLTALLAKLEQAHQVRPVEPEGPANPSGQLILSVMSQTTGQANFGISYYTSQAGWLPAYDMRIKSVDNSFNLMFKATLTQSTGINWKNTPISLATQNPARTGGMPILNPIYLREYVPQLYSVMEKSAAGKGVPQLYSDNKVEETLATSSNVGAYTTLTESMLNINYDIALPYTIPSDGKPYNINIIEKPVTARFAHFAIPKVDRDAHFVANIARWDSLNLLPGEANIILDNTYIGKTFIDPAQASDTMVLSLGRDKRISLTRTIVKELTTTQIKGNTKLNVYVYEIVLRNNKKQRVNLKLQDQFPISREKELEVKLLKNGGADTNEETGILSWEIQLEPGETRKVRFSYQVKHDAGKKVKEYH